MLVPSLWLALAGCNDASLTVNNTDPEVAIVTPTEGFAFGVGQDILVQAKVKDAQSANDELVVSLSAEPDGPVGSEPSPTDDGFAWVILGGLPEGEHTLRVTAIDPSDADGDDAVGISVVSHDRDGDGFVDADEGGDDCDDDDRDVHPGADERCNGRDDDCDGDVDEDAVDAPTWFADGDGDGYGAGEGTVSCTGVGVRDGTDCDDGDATVHPAATETCDAVDQDCDGDIDDGGVCPCEVTWYDGHAYELCTTAEDWWSAAASCEANGYELASLGDAAEDAFVDAAIDGVDPGYWWMGLSDQATEGTWLWPDGAAATYTHWGDGEPNNLVGDEDCGELNRFPSGEWNDETCWETKPFVCEAG